MVIITFLSSASGSSSHLFLWSFGIVRGSQLRRDSEPFSRRWKEPRGDVNAFRRGDDGQIRFACPASNGFGFYAAGLEKLYSNQLSFIYFLKGTVYLWNRLPVRCKHILSTGDGHWLVTGSAGGLDVKRSPSEPEPAWSVTAGRPGQRISRKSCSLSAPQEISLLTTALRII